MEDSGCSVGGNMVWETGTGVHGVEDLKNAVVIYPILTTEVTSPVPS